MKRRHPATMRDLEDLPEHVRGEIIDGELYTSPRPRFLHANVESAIVGDVFNPFQRGRGGPGGWWILVEPGIEHPRAVEYAPDVAGWRRERMPHPPAPGEPIRVVPDWACEILSPSTRSDDRVIKRRFYADIGVRWLWYVDLDARTLEVSRLHEGQWLEVLVVGGDTKVRAEPFEAVEMDLGYWWSPEGAPTERDPSSGDAP